MLIGLKSANVVGLVFFGIRARKVLEVLLGYSRPSRNAEVATTISVLRMKKVPENPSGPGALSLFKGLIAANTSSVDVGRNGVVLSARLTSSRIASRKSPSYRIGSLAKIFSK